MYHTTESPFDLQETSGSARAGVARRLAWTASGVTAVLISCVVILGHTGCDAATSLVSSLAGLPPAVNSASPQTGSVAGGTEVTIQGDGFQSSTSVLFGDTVAASVRVVNEGLIIATTPPHAAGAVPIVLALPNGSKSSTAYTFTYADSSSTGKPLPVTVGSIVPASGPTGGGSRLTVSGANFESGMVVLVGALLGTDVTVIDSQTFTVVTPAQAAGTVDVVIRASEGRTAVVPAAFTYQAASVDSLSPVSGPSDGGTKVTITGAHFAQGTSVLFGSAVGSGVDVINESTLTVVTPKHSAGMVDVILTGRDGTPVVVENAFEFVEPVIDLFPGGPRVVSALSTGNTKIVVTFSEPVGEGADLPANYNIVTKNVNPEAGSLSVQAVVLGSDKTRATLTTLSQSEVVYQLTVTNIKDLLGNPLAAPTVLVNPTTATFAGTPPANGGVDTDKDGLSDADEQKGWIISVKLANGQFVTRGVTSDPTIADTDGDGLNDAEEKAINLDPRNRDTDADQLADAEEWNEWYSDPANQDTDGDGLSDSLELFFGTSPVIADTDGDQMNDAVEIIDRNRNPLIADLPLPQITVDEVRLGLKITSNYTDEQGTVRSVSDSTSTSFAQSRSETTGRSDTNSTESENTFGQKIGGEYKWGAGADVWTAKIAAEASFGQKRTRGFSSTVSSEVAQVSQQEYQRSISNALMASQRRAVTRTIDQATIQANVNVANRSDIAFTITNLEISVQQQDRRNGRLFRPIATLRPSGASDPLNQPSYNLGPFDPERGPIIFQNVEVFPNLIDDLMREPTGLIFQVVNYDIYDEFGRNFVFSSQEVNDRTVGITLDFGNGVVESYRIATASKFDAAGRALGISMQRAFEIAGITRTLGDDQPRVSSDPLPDTIRKTYGTIVDNSGVERLVRVRGVQNDLVAVPEAEKRFWAIVTSNTDLPPDSNFSTIQVHAGDDFLLFYTRDVDKDGLFEREEYLYGSSDRDADTDDDGLDDYFEVRTGWTVYKLPGLPYKTFSDPAREDSDGDGVRDDVEFRCGLDPNRADTDEDGMLDAAELLEEIDLKLFDGDADDSNDKYLLLTPYSSWAIIDGGNGKANTAKSGDDIQVIAVGDTVVPGDIVIAPGPNGVLDTTPAGDDIASLAEAIDPGPDGVLDTTPAQGTDDVASQEVSGRPIIRAGRNNQIDTIPVHDDFVRVAHDGLFTIDPRNRDTDYDGIPDGRELLLGTNPNRKDASSITDSDGDGLYDIEEENGWEVTVWAADGTPSTVHVTSNKFRADTDQDGLPDVYEWAIKSNPRLADTDGDTLLDVNEFDPDDTDHYYEARALLEASRRCGSCEHCSALPAIDPANRLRTNVLKVDSDGDGLADNVELSTPWTVSVYGGMPYQAFSKPYSADADSDGLTDTQELAAGTDPNKADTDGDAIAGLNGTDKYEIDNGRNPLRKDQKITFTYTYVSVSDTGENDNNDKAEFSGSLYLTLPDSTTQLVYTCSSCCRTIGDCAITGGSYSFLINEGQSFAAWSNQWVEVDDVFDDIIGTFSDTNTYPVSATSDVYSFTGGPGATWVQIRYTIVVK